MNTLIIDRIKKIAVTLGVCVLCVGPSHARAATLALPDAPLLLLNTVEPNLLLTFDDSGSMDFAFLPDNIGYNQDGSDATSLVNRADRSASCSSVWNKSYYNPATTYKPAENSIGGPLNLTATSFTNAYTDGHHRTTGFTANTGTTMAATVNLTNQYRVSWNHFGFAATFGAEFAPCNTGTIANQAAFYYSYTVGALCPANPTTAPANTCFTRVNIAGTGQEQNFANWYSYYRTRDLTAKTAAGRAFARLGTNVRVSGQQLNNPDAVIGADIRFSTTVGTMRRFCDDPSSTDPLCANGSTARTDFFTRLYNSNPRAGGTPLRPAMVRAGVHFGSTNTGNDSPYRDVPGNADTVANPNPERSCRKNFHIMMTDGYWNGGAGVGTNADGLTQTLGDGTAYAVAKSPYSDGFTDTLADSAFHSWFTDLRTLPNNVPTRYTVGNATTDYFNSRNDPANWQHMVTYTIGMGITGTRNPANYFDLTLADSAGDWDELKAAPSWPNPTLAENGTRVDDLWHAAINGRGQYFSASDPQGLINAFTTIINQVSAEGGSGSGLGASGSSTAGGTSVYQVRYHPNRWSGRLLAFPVNTSGIVSATASWDAGSSGLNTQNYDTARNIFTYKTGTGGVPFRWASLDTAQQDALNRDASNVADTKGEARLEYLRGASTNEGPGNPVNASSFQFRERACLDFTTITAANPTLLATCPANVGKLGDIVNSAAVYVGKPPFAYPDSIEGAANKYSDFVTLRSGRTKMVYVGANDGMLHGFDAADGKEKMAYVPNLVYANDAANNLALFTSPTYSHRFYVDGTPTVGDVFYGGAWHTVMVGGLRKGGRGYYALDITNPADFTESAANATGLVKWEISNADPVYANLGYSYNQPTIIKMTNPSVGVSRWAAIFGNGYNSTSATGTASLFVVNIDTGAPIREIDTGIGDATTPNGLGTPTVVDIDGDQIADYVYAGDLLGNMWRFDIRNADATTWSVSSIFTATVSAAVSAAVQPITTRPAVGFHPDGFGGLMVYFGTGKYLEAADNSVPASPQTQTFYAIYDRGVTARRTVASVAVTVARSALLAQTISTPTSSPDPDFDVRAITDNSISWRLTQDVVLGTHLGWYVDLPTPGERQVTDPLLREGRIIFSTLIPTSDPCVPGGTGWLMELNATNGGQLKDTFDINEDGTFTAADRVSGNGVAGIASTDITKGSALSSPIVLTNPSAERPPSGSACKETKLAVSTKGNIIRIAESCAPYDVREGWRQRK